MAHRSRKGTPSMQAMKLGSGKTPEKGGQKVKLREGTEDVG